MLDAVIHYPQSKMKPRFAEPCCLRIDADYAKPIPEPDQKLTEWSGGASKPPIAVEANR